MPASALDKVFSSAGEVLFERNTPTINHEATLGERIDLHISGQPEVSYAQDEKEERLFLTPSLTKQVLNYLNESTMIADLIKKSTGKY